MIVKTETYTLPAYLACYLINDDSSGLEDNELAEIDAWLKKTRGDRKEFYPTCPEGEPSFSHHNDLNDLGGDVLDFDFIVSD